MGSDLVHTEAPRFWVWASQDPAGVPLDRIQIIKGWIENREQRQRSNGRVPGENGQCPKTGDQGARELQVTFSDAPPLVTIRSAPRERPVTRQRFPRAETA